MIVEGDDAVSKNVITKVIMDSGEEFTLQYKPIELINKFTHDGKIRDEFIEFGILYINPKHVSMMLYEEEEEGNPNIPFMGCIEGIDK